MALTDFQRTVCRLLADHRISSGESYVAGDVALTSTGDLFRGDATELQAAVDRDQLVFHPGRIGWAWPEIKQR